MAQPPVGLSHFLVCSPSFLSFASLSILFYSIPFHSITPPSPFDSVRFPFDSFLRYSLRFHDSLVISEASLYINRCTIQGSLKLDLVNKSTCLCLEQTLEHFLYKSFWSYLRKTCCGAKSRHHQTTTQTTRQSTRDISQASSSTWST